MKRDKDKVRIKVQTGIPQSQRDLRPPAVHRCGLRMHQFDGGYLSSRHRTPVCPYDDSCPRPTNVGGGPGSRVPSPGLDLGNSGQAPRL